MKKLSYQLILIFTLVIIILSIVFSIFLNSKLNNIYISENYNRIEQILNGLKMDSNNIYIPKDVSYFIKNLSNGSISKNLSNEYKVDESFINSIFLEVNSDFPKRIEKQYSNNTYFFVGYKVNQNKFLVLSNDSYIVSKTNENLIQILLIFVIILILGNLIITFWSRWIVNRILFIKKNLNNKELIENTNGLKLYNDEITDLTITIFDMRKEIYQNEKVKEEMLQNISHDFKTPIAVIKSYSEAIRDKIVEIDSIDIILKQTDLLNKKVYQLLEITKLEYLSHQNIALTEINVKNIIENLIPNYNLNKEVKLYLSLNDLYFKGIYDNLYTVFDNLLDNAFRYARSKVEIKVDNNGISIYNDGENIKDDFVDKIFKPYEKSNKGKFGLGMSIVKRTLEMFEIEITVENLSNGVIFKIFKKSAELKN